MRSFRSSNTTANKWAPAVKQAAAFTVAAGVRALHLTLAALSDIAVWMSTHAPAPVPTTHDTLAFSIEYLCQLDIELSKCKNLLEIIDS